MKFKYQLLIMGVILFLVSMYMKGLEIQQKEATKNTPSTIKTYNCSVDFGHDKISIISRVPCNEITTTTRYNAIQEYYSHPASSNLSPVWNGQ